MICFPVTMPSLIDSKATTHYHYMIRELVIDIRNWASAAVQYSDLPNDFGTMQRFETFVANLCDRALLNNGSWEHEFFSRLDSSLFAKYAIRKYYVDHCFFPPRNELCVDGCSGA